MMRQEELYLGLGEEDCVVGAGDGAGVVVGAIWMAADEPTSRRAHVRQE